MQELTEEHLNGILSNKIIDWGGISAYFILNEDFIRQYQDKVVWDYICFYQKLSESFIREFQDKVQWDCISQRQILSEEFMIEYQDKIDFIRILEKQKPLSKQLQDIILYKLFDAIKEGRIFKKALTPYMRKQFKKLNMFT